jgi:hypothetical protein
MDPSTGACQLACCRESTNHGMSLNYSLLDQLLFLLLGIKYFCTFFDSVRNIPISIAQKMIIC